MSLLFFYASPSPQGSGRSEREGENGAIVTMRGDETRAGRSMTVAKGFAKFSRVKIDAGRIYVFVGKLGSFLSSSYTLIMGGGGWETLGTNKKAWQ